MPEAFFFSDVLLLLVLLTFSCVTFVLKGEIKVYNNNNNHHHFYYYLGQAGSPSKG